MYLSCAESWVTKPTRSRFSGLKIETALSLAVSPTKSLLAWVVWVQLRKKKWLPISCKRHQIGHLEFSPHRLLTASEEVRAVTHDLGLSPTQSRKSEVDSETNSR